MPDQDRTEDPTPRRREEARRRGQVARSMELNSAVVLLAFVGMASSCVVQFVGNVERMTASYLGGLRFHAVTMGRVMEDLGSLLAGPLLLTVLVIAAVNLAQTQFVVSSEYVSMERINPVAGLRRIFSTRGLFELGRSALKTAVIGWVAYGWISAALPTLIALSGQSTHDVLLAVSGLIVSLAWRVALIGLVFAVVDAAWQRRQFEQGLRMTRQEVRDEHRQNEGDPRMRSRRREAARRMSSARMLTMVPHADVVLTNPDHLAVALVYREAVMAVPRVVAKGGGDVARAIRETARRFDIPVLESRPLARALYATTDVGDEIPEELYEAVAHVMAYLLDMRDGR